MSVHVNCIEVKPVSNGRTEYDITDLTGKVEVAAHKNDVNITQSGTLRTTSSQGSSQSATVHEGQQATRDETTVCGAASPPERASSGLNTKWLEIGGGVSGGAIILCILLSKGPTPSSVSPSQP
jgi:hypothetical protein